MISVLVTTTVLSHARDASHSFPLPHVPRINPFNTTLHLPLLRTPSIPAGKRYWIDTTRPHSNGEFIFGRQVDIGWDESRSTLVGYVGGSCRGRCCDEGLSLDRNSS